MDSSMSDIKETKWIKHYSSSHKILLVGEGDFSFSACLAIAFGSATNMVATSLDSKAALLLKYSMAAAHLQKLEELGCTIIHEVDAHTILHQKLVKGFFRSAMEMLSKDGEVHVTHKTAHPFDKWEIVELATEVGLYLIRSVSFATWDYPGYCNKRGQGISCDQSFPVGQCSTYKFRKCSIVDLL